MCVYVYIYVYSLHLHLHLHLHLLLLRRRLHESSLARPLGQAEDLPQGLQRIAAPGIPGTLWETYKKRWKIAILKGYINYFYGNFKG